MYGEKAGYLRVANTRVSSGKLIDEWVFVSPLEVRGRKAPQMSVKVSMKSRDRSIEFVAHGDCLPKEIVDTDIERLRQAVEDELRFQHDSATGLKWEDWLEVQVRAPTKGGRAEIHNGLILDVRPMKRTLDPATGGALMLNANNLVSPFPTAKAAGEQDPDADHPMSGRDADASFSYVPATESNRAALSNISARVDELRDALTAFLSQSQVEDSLLKLGAFALLPDPTRECD
jgi:hypothetical protein